MKIYSQGDQAIVVSIEKKVSKDLTEDLLALRTYLNERNYPFITEIVPTESDMMIIYDARDMIKHHHIQSPFLYMKALIESVQLEISHNDQHKEPIQIPIVYGDEYGPDLDALLKHFKIDKSQFIQLHSGSEYFVSMMGYSPGFPYLTGSVVIEGKKCGIVTTDTYNDWLVIGYTPLQLFFPNKTDFALLKLGDNVQFIAKEKNDLNLGDLKTCQS